MGADKFRIYPMVLTVLLKKKERKVGLKGGEDKRQNRRAAELFCVSLRRKKG